jgi:hypothetical protein
MPRRIRAANGRRRNLPDGLLAQVDDLDRAARAGRLAPPPVPLEAPQADDGTPAGAEALAPAPPVVAPWRLQHPRSWAVPSAARAEVARR